MTGISVPILGRMRRNLLIRAEEYDNSIWSKSSLTVTADAIAGPDGMTTADKLVEAAASAEHYAAQSVAPLAGAMTGSVFVKAGERTNFMLLLFGTTATGNADRYAVFDLSAVTVTDVLAGVTATIRDVGNGWRRATLTTNIASTDGVVSLYNYVMSGSTYAGRSYLGDGSSGVYVIGAQLERGPVATSYIKTREVSRSAA